MLQYNAETWIVILSQSCELAIVACTREETRKKPSNEVEWKMTDTFADKCVECANRIQAHNVRMLSCVNRTFHSTINSALFGKFFEKQIRSLHIREDYKYFQPVFKHVSEDTLHFELFLQTGWQRWPALFHTNPTVGSKTKIEVYLNIPFDFFNVKEEDKNWARNWQQQHVDWQALKSITTYVHEWEIQNVLQYDEERFMDFDYSTMLPTLISKQRKCYLHQEKAEKRFGFDCFPQLKRKNGEDDIQLYDLTLKATLYNAVRVELNGLGPQIFSSFCSKISIYEQAKCPKNIVLHLRNLPLCRKLSLSTRALITNTALCLHCFMRTRKYISIDATTTDPDEPARKEYHRQVSRHELRALCEVCFEFLFVNVKDLSTNRFGLHRDHVSKLQEQYFEGEISTFRYLATNNQERKKLLPLNYFDKAFMPHYVKQGFVCQHSETRRVFLKDDLCKIWSLNTWSEFVQKIFGSKRSKHAAI